MIITKDNTFVGIFVAMGSGDFFQQKVKLKLEAGSKEI